MICEDDHNCEYYPILSCKINDVKWFIIKVRCDNRYIFYRCFYETNGKPILLEIPTCSTSPILNEKIKETYRIRHETKGKLLPSEKITSTISLKGIIHEFDRKFLNPRKIRNKNRYKVKRKNIKYFNL